MDIETLTPAVVETPAPVKATRKKAPSAPNKAEQGAASPTTPKRDGNAERLVCEAWQDVTTGRTGGTFKGVHDTSDYYRRIGLAYLALADAPERVRRGASVPVKYAPNGPTLSASVDTLMIQGAASGSVWTATKRGRAE